MWVGLVCGQEFLKVKGAHLAVLVRQSEYFVAGGLHGAGLVHVDVGCLHCHDTFSRCQYRVKRYGVGLRAAGEEVNACLWSTTLAAYALSRALAPAVVAVTGTHLTVGVNQVLQHLGTRPVVVVALE